MERCVSRQVPRLCQQRTSDNARSCRRRSGTLCVQIFLSMLSWRSRLKRPSAQLVIRSYSNKHTYLCVQCCSVIPSRGSTTVRRIRRCGENSTGTRSTGGKCTQGRQTGRYRHLIITASLLRARRTPRLFFGLQKLFSSARQGAWKSRQPTCTGVRFAAVGA